MFFVLSKTLGFLAMPLTLICLLFLLSVLVKKMMLRKVFFWTALGMLLFFSNDFLANEAMRAWEIPPTPYAEITRTYDYGVMLTGVTLNDFQPDDRVYFSRGADRVVHTVDLYKRGIIKKILVSGGEGRLIHSGRREADDVFKAMKLMGVDTVDIIVENESRNTYESAVNVKAMMGENADGQLLLITSAFHLRRSRACFRKAGIQAEIFSTDFYSHPRYFDPGSLLVPKAEALAVWHKLFKEWMGILAYKVAGYI
jgi:uncharacterized SAM-binding protein YcdF (DUF218 family)